MRCKLCHMETSSLKRSHYMPAGVYKAIRESESDNPNPYLLRQNHSALQTSDQITAPLLCADCEQLFNKRGESWVLRHMLRNDGDFPLLKLLEDAGPSYVENADNKVYQAGAVSKINVDALIYFAASLFWRGAIYPWTSDKRVPVELGSYREQIGAFLMGQSGFPSHAMLWVAIRKKHDFNRAVMFPYGGRSDEGFHRYNFSIPGIAFTLSVGKCIPLKYKNFCFVRGAGHPLIEAPIVDVFIRQHAARMAFPKK